MQEALAGDVGEDQDGEADQLRDGGGHGRPGHPQVQGEDEDGVQDAVEDAAEAHAEHGAHGAALGAQALVHHEVAGHEGGHQEHVGGVLDRVLLAGVCSAQQAHHGLHERDAQHHDHRAESHGQEEGRGDDPVGLLLLPGPQEAGDVAGRAHRQHGPCHHDDLVQGGVDADGS